MAPRNRNFVTIVYPESAPADWLQILSDSYLNFIVSPLHDKDLNPDGEIKKAHYHVMLLFDSMKTNEQAAAEFSLINGVGLEPVKALRSMLRYFCHLDNPDKVEYNTNDVKVFGSVDYYDLIKSNADRYSSISEMIDFCEENNYYSFAQLLLYCRLYREDWFHVLCDNGTFVMREFLRSRRYDRDNLTDSLD